MVCGGNGCCKKPDTCVGMAVLIVSIFGLLASLVWLSAYVWPIYSWEECCDDGSEDVCAEEGLALGECVDRHLMIWMIMAYAFHLGQYWGPFYMLGIALALTGLSHIIGTTGFSLPVCCCTSASGYKCSAIVLGVGIGFYTVAFFMGVGFHGAVGAEIDGADWDQEDKDNVHEFVAFFMGVVYAMILVPCLLGVADCGLLCKGKADWPEEGGAAASQEMPVVGAPVVGAAVTVTIEEPVEKSPTAEA